MIREDDISKKLEKESETDCPICFDPLQSDVELLLCCSTSASLKALHTNCAKMTFEKKDACPLCRNEQPKHITLDSESFNKLSGLTKEELKPILDLGKSQTPEIFLNSVKLILAAFSDKQKDLYFFLCENNLVSKEYFDDSSLSVKLVKLLDDKVSPEVMLNVIEKYIEMKKDIDATEENGTALLNICYAWPKAKIPPEITLLVIDKLLKAKANMKMANDNGWTALHLVCRHWPEADVPFKIMVSTISKFLETNTLDINAATIDGWTVLHLICWDWVEAKVDPHIILAVIDELLKAKANVNAVTEENWTALHYICRYWPEEKVPVEIILTVIDKFLEAGIDVNIVTQDGWSLLHCVCHYWPKIGISHEMIFAVIGKFLAAGIKVDAPNKDGKTALQYLEKFNNTKNLLQNINLLQVAHKAPPKLKDFYSFLLQNNLNSQEYLNDSPLPVKIAKLLTEIISSDLLLDTIEKFIAMRMDVNATDEKGCSALPYIYNALTEKKISQKTALTIIENLFVAGIKIAENEKKQLKKVWKQLKNKNALHLQKFKTSALESDNYHYPLAFARLYRATQSSTQESNEGYQRVIKLLLKPRRYFAFSEEQLQILEEISSFDKQLLPPQLVSGLQLLFTENIVKGDGNKAHRYFFQAAKAGWLVGYILAAYQYERGIGVAKKLDQAIEYYREVIFSSDTATNNLNKKCFTFALKKLHKLANEKEKLSAQKVLADYYLQSERNTEAMELFLKVKNNAEEIQRQKLVVDKPFNSLITETNLTLGKLFNDSKGLAEALTCYCAVLTTASPSEITEALKNLILIAPAVINTDKTVAFKTIFALADFIDLNRKDVTALQIPLLLKLIRALKLEKLFLETSTSKLEPPSKFKLFAHKLASKPNLSTDCARALGLLIDENQRIENISPEKAQKFMQFYAQILEGTSELPEHLVNKEICQRAEQILQDLEKNLSALPGLIQ